MFTATSTALTELLGQFADAFQQTDRLLRLNTPLSSDLNRFALLMFLLWAQTGPT